MSYCDRQGPGWGENWWLEGEEGGREGEGEGSKIKKKHIKSKPLSQATRRKKKNKKNQKTTKKENKNSKRRATKETKT